MELDTLDELLVLKLRDLYDAEKQLTKALPKMAKKASSKELKKIFESHLKETNNQVGRLETVFKELQIPARGHKCMGIQGLIEEGKELMKEDVEKEAMDVLLIDSAQSIEHYEIGGYASALFFSDLLGYEKISELLVETLEEEEAADDMLYDLLEEIIQLEVEV
jgi:ferritin-like metal-binding protein YciE